MARARRSSTSAATGQTTAVALVALRALHPHPENPRRISRARLDQLKATLAADPAMLQARPLIALPDGTVIAGNQRLRAALELGWSELPVVYADLDEQTARLWMLRDNNAFGDWDEKPLAEMLAALGKGGVELALAGFEGKTVDELLKGLTVERPDADDVPPVPTEPRSKVGEVYELGPHRLMCGDSTDLAHVEGLVGGHTFACVVTDPPYGIDREGVANDDPRGLRALYDGVRAAAPLGDAVLAVFQSPRLLPEWLDASRAAGLRFERLLWLHRQAATKTYPWRGWVLASDAIALSSVGNPTWPDPADFCHDTYVKLELEPASLTGTHTTIKPAWVVGDLISKLPAGDIYEPFAGSGTAIIAADQLDRRCFAMEIDPGYCDVIRDRYTAWSAAP